MMHIQQINEPKIQPNLTASPACSCCDYVVQNNIVPWDGTIVVLPPHPQ
jgi:hypothetical protein